MRTVSILRMAAALTLIVVVTPAWADGIHSFGRWAGIGWGDGYHSHYACPPRHGAIRHDQKLPWWATPADGAEALPAAAPTRAPAHNSFPPQGQSLFRQPGEGSSVTVSSQPR